MIFRIESDLPVIGLHVPAGAAGLARFEFITSLDVLATQA